MENSLFDFNKDKEKQHSTKTIKKPNEARVMGTAKDLGKKIQEARTRKGLSINDVHDQTRMHPSVIKDIENGVFDKMNNLYLRSFVKKYAGFVGEDVDKIMTEYDFVTSGGGEEKFTLAVEDKEDKKNFEMADLKPKLQVALVAVLSIVLIVLFFVLIGRFKAKVAKRAETLPTATDLIIAEVEEAAKSKAAVTPVETAQKTTQETAPVPVVEKTPVKKVVTRQLPVVLTLKATGEVWVQVSNSKTDEVLFTGFLNSGDSKTFTSESPIMVWSGKAERLEFLLNTRKAGTVAKGVVKDILVTSKGIKVGDSWVYSLE